MYYQHGWKFLYVYQYSTWRFPTKRGDFEPGKTVEVEESLTHDYLEFSYSFFNSSRVPTSHILLASLEDW